MTPPRDYPIVRPSDLDADNWHEGTQALGYWPEGDSIIFQGFDKTYFCITVGFLEKLARGELELDPSSA